MFHMSAISEYPQRHSVSAEEYLRMAEAGVFAPDARLELIEGEIIEMAPIGSPHSGRVNILNKLFVQRAGDRAIVSVQHPVIASRRSVPQPDLALLAPRADSYCDSHPTGSEILLVVEVADSTILFDLGTKVPLYARCGVREVWIVDVNERVIHVYRDPEPSGYRKTFTASGNERVASVALPDVWVAVRDLWPSD